MMIMVVTLLLLMMIMIIRATRKLMIITRTIRIEKEVMTFSKTNSIHGCVNQQIRATQISDDNDDDDDDKKIMAMAALALRTDPMKFYYSLC